MWTYNDDFDDDIYDGKPLVPVLAHIVIVTLLLFYY